MSPSTTLPSTSGALRLTLPSTSLRYAQDERSEKPCILSVGLLRTESKDQDRPSVIRNGTFIQIA